MTSIRRFFATSPRGLEALVARELGAMGIGERRETRGGVDFCTSIAGAYRACLWSRVANRILLPLSEFRAGDDKDLYEGVRGIDWLEHLGEGRTLAVDYTAVRAPITHGRFAAQRVKDAVVDQFRARGRPRPAVDTRRPDLRINVHMHGDQATVSVDLSGESLHRRGYRQAAAAAPLKENLAAAILMRADWPALAAAGGGLVDPMCGTGTLAIEAAWMASDTAPGILRSRFGFMGWRGHDDATWKALVDEALERQAAGLASLPPIVAFDHERTAVRAALANVERAGLAGRVHVERRELAQATPPAACRTGLVATNPPYGERLAEHHELLPLYLRLGETLKRSFGGWRAMVLNGVGCRIGLKPHKSWQLFNGPIECRLERFEIGDQPGAPRTLPAEDLVNRVRKNHRRLRRWLEREGVSCYRVYDADIPEYALAVDVYADDNGRWLHVQEYAPPNSVDPGRAQARLQQALTALPQALDIPPDRLIFKVRRRQRGTAQYERMSKAGRTLVVAEGPCRLEVNLTDYLDTGLFLDHRPVRQWLRGAAGGKRFLNLFCYTGAATVHAAVGGAASTTSVDLSKTYLAWARRNLALNGCDRGHHETVHADARGWLADCRRRFDLIFLDPPSFSNSKRMSGSFDIQRDHADLVREAATCLADDGVLVFSTNRRDFSIDPSLPPAFAIEDRTAWSIPPDFRRRRAIHRCWFIRRR